MAIGCYTPLYLPASFKGVPFLAEEVTSEHGRRGAEGEFPFSENTAYADLGRKIRRYTLKGRYMNNAHIASAATLIAVCESPGPGLLIHPTRGALTVACVKLSVTDDPLNEQGITHLDMEFVEANIIATGLSIGASLFGLGTDLLFGALADAFHDNYDLDKVRYYRVQDVQSSVSNSMDAIRIEFSKNIAGTDVNKNWSALATMDGYVTDPSRIRGSTATFRAFKNASMTLSNVSHGQSKYDSFKNIVNNTAIVSTLPEEAGTAENAVYSMVRTMAASFMVKAALEMSDTTIDQSLARYDEIVAVIAQELSNARATCEDDVYIELSNFATDAKKALLQKAYGLPALIEYNFHGGVPSLLAAYDIFNDAKRFKEIEDRNPGQVPWHMGPSIIAVRQ